MEYKRSDIREITLLSLEDYERNHYIIPTSDNWWWLKSGSPFRRNVAYVFIDGDAYAQGYKVTSCADIRPLIYIDNEKSKDLVPGSVVKIGKYTATVLSDRSCLIDYGVCRRRFDSDYNDYERSEIKKYLQTDEFMNMLCG